ncbi:uncharacterized protein Dwil_GK16518 [Drosophila willistoni]|uniref:Uncharacterized protein n=1 Tax=Drosophila willistoni TaxID=7260 RepID=B4N2J5_DROWI|nr:uncharacterized protein Dwil_GK16518 [Drosophila willistoni]
MPEILNVMEMEMEETVPAEIVEMSTPGMVNVVTIFSNNNNNNNTTDNTNNSNNNNNNNNNNSTINIDTSSSETQTQSQIVPASPKHQVEQSNFVAIPLLERRRRSRSHSRCRIAPLAPIICIQNVSLHIEQQEQQQLSRYRACYHRIRRSFAKFFGIIMGSNNPSEADRYDYYDCE